MQHDVIVCVHNSYDDVKNCLDSLIQFWSCEKLHRLIIVDDCSLGDTASLLRDYEKRNSFVDVVRLNEQHYYTRAANRGLMESTAAIRTLLNSDTIVTPRWATNIRRAFTENASVGIVGPLSNAASTQSVPLVKGSENQTAINSLPPAVSISEFGEFIELSSIGRIRPYVPLVHGFCLSVREEVIDEVGYFDGDAFPRGYGEENDFCFRAEDAGFILSIAIDTFVFHAKSKSYTSSDRVQFMRDGMRNFVAKHGERRVKQAVKFMEENPHLQMMRESVLMRWPDHYEPSYRPAESSLGV